MAALSPALISANGLALAYGAAPLLEEVTLSVAPSEKVGLVGRNGCGKTSLLKILAGELAADAGEISRRRGLRVGYLPQEFELDGHRTVQQNIEAGAADLLDWIARYEAGIGSDDELAEVQRTVGTCNHGLMRALPRWARRHWMHSLVHFLVVRNGVSRCAVHWWPSRTCSCSTNQPTISTRSRFAGSKSFCNDFRAQ